MENEILALIGGAFKNAATMGSTVSKGDKLGIIRQFGTPIPVVANCTGTVQWIREDGVVRSHDRLYKVTSHDILAIVLESADADDISDTPLAEAAPVPEPTRKSPTPKKRRAPKRKG